MIFKEQYSNLSCFEELDIRCAMYGHEMPDVAEECGISITDKNDVQFHLIPTTSGLIWFLNGSRIDPPEVWDGDFSLWYNGLWYNDLVSLIGCPKKVSGNFNCGDNRLTSLFGAPSKVGGYFICYHNQLSSLSGAPTKVGGDFYCSYNKLTSLVGVPAEVNGDFWCNNNRLISLSGAPSKVGKDFWCDKNAVNFTKEQVKKTTNVKGAIHV